MASVAKLAALSLLAVALAKRPKDRVARAWRPGAVGAWPEDPLLEGAPSLGICLSGGGSRAYTAAMGLLRGLHDLGVLQQARYLVGVSGGAWATAAYTYAQGDELSDEALLGEIWEPEATTREQLAQLDERSARFAPTRGFLAIAAEEALLAAAAPWRALDEVWERTVARVFLEPMGISRSALFSWNSSARDELVARNPDLAKETWLLPRRPRPFPIICTTFLGPPEFQPPKIEERFHVQSEVTPLYAGVPYNINATYRNKRNGREKTILLGGLVEPIGYSAKTMHSQGVGPSRTEAKLTVEAPRREFSLARAVSESSFQPGVGLSETHPLIGNIITDEIDYYAPSAAEPASTRMLVTDGGSSENSGIYALLRRRVRRIVMSYNPPVGLAEPRRWDPSARPPVYGEVDDAFAALWGVYVNPKDYNNTQVFARETFAPIATELQASIAAGRGAVATVKLTTLENQRFGIPGGVETTVTILYLARAHAWEDRLPADVRAALNTSDFPDWPAYPTLRLTLSKEQINALASMMGHVVKSNAAEFEDIVSAPVIV